MTTRYRLHANSTAIAARFGADAGRDPWEAGEMTPGAYGPVIVRTPGGLRRIVPRQWGVPPPPRAALLGGPAVPTVRNVESPFWIGTLRHREFRCLVPVTAFRAGARARGGGPDGGWYGLSASPLFALAGIWRDSEVASFAILTCEANRLVRAHGAEVMPVILHAEDHESWLGDDWKQAQRLVAPFPSQLMDRAGGTAPGATG